MSQATAAGARMCQGTFFSITVLFAAAALIESRVTCIEVLGVKVFLYHPECFAKTLEVYDLPGTQETNRIYNVRVFYDTKNVIVSGAGFLLWGDFVKTTLHNII